MNKKLASGILSAVIFIVAGYYFFQDVSGNTDLMLNYIEETNYLTDDYNLILAEEEMITSEDELVAFTEEVSIPALEKIYEDTKAYGQTITNPKLKEVHDLHVQAMELRLKADLKWLDGEDSGELYEQSDLLLKNMKQN
ncbi:MAG: hypothetical protein LRY73_07435 [Bacillus sp. (in: Bacteria)]|nr:hypothetical protein [Bacillus sp. (in: firmicutes)]